MIIIYIKRIIAISGDEILLNDNSIYINNIEIHPYNYNGVKTEYSLSINQFLVIGDNYNNSVDSRIFGLIESPNIIGKVIYKF